MIRAIDRKLLRDLMRMKMQGIAIALVMSCGVAAFVMALCTLLALQGTRESYYRDARFAEVFAQVKRAPRSLADRIADIPGIAAVEARVVVDVNLDVPGLEDPATGRIISLPDLRDPRLNRVFLRRGRMPEYGRLGEAVASEAFMLAHGLDLGAKIPAVVNGRRQHLMIVGIGLSPEYIYPIRPGEILPDDVRFGIFWMRYSEIAEAFDMEGAFNDVALTLLPGAREAEVIRRLDDLLEPYGSGGGFGRDQQISHRYISDELQQLRTMSIVAPSVFLSVAAFLLNIVLTRIIRTQREQIAALKAFGYARGEIALHYLKLVLVLGVLGALIGVLLGRQLGVQMTAMYTNFFRFPVFSFSLDPRVVIGAVGMTVGIGAIGALGAVRQAASLPPAEAMRPEPPPEYRPTLIEQIGLQRFFAGPTRMILRKLESHPFRAALTTVGISFGIAVVILGNFSLDAVNEMIDFQFARSQRQHLTVTLFEPASPGAAFEFERLPGVLSAEVFRSVPVRLRAGSRERRVAILGLPGDARLQRILATDGRRVDPPPEGLLVSESLADLLGVRPGDRITVVVLEGRRPVRDVKVAATVAGYIGIAAYMDRAALNRFMQEGSVISGAYLSTDAAQLPVLYRTLKEMPRVAGVTIKARALESFERTVAENILFMRAVNTIFATIIAFGVVYNAARITLAERSRELATMRVLGFRRADVSYVLLGELGVLVALAIPVGFGVGWGMAWIFVSAMKTESYSIPLVISPATFAYAASVTLVGAVISALLVRRSVDRLDLIAVLKNA